jgi:hypothetical protein
MWRLLILNLGNHLTTFHSKMSSDLTIHSFLLGARTEAAKRIPENPFYNGTMDRITAERLILVSRLPILRKSSITGMYAVTFICPVRRTVIHSLLDQRDDLSVVVCDLRSGETPQVFSTIYDLLTEIISPDVLSALSSTSSSESFPITHDSTRDSTSDPRGLTM